MFGCMLPFLRVMCNGWIAAVCVIRAVLSLLGLDAVSMLVMGVCDKLPQIGGLYQVKLRNRV